MSGSSRLFAAAVGSVVLLCLPGAARGQSGVEPVARLVSAASGSIAGVVRDERGAPIAGAMVSAFGPSQAIAVTDRAGRFELRTLSPGPYVVRAHVTGFVGAPGQTVDVRSSVRSASSIALRRASASSTTSAPAPPPVLLAGVGGAVGSIPAPEAQPAAGEQAGSAPATDGSDPAIDDDHGEVAWRLRHIRRSVLRDVVVPIDLLTNDAQPDARAFGPGLDGRRGLGSAAGFASNLFTGMPLTGQFNLLTTGSFDSPQQLFAGDSLSRGIAYVSLAAPVGEYSDWSMRGALTQGDLSSWFVAGAYVRRGPGRHRYDVGLSYSTQRYDGGNTAALRDVTEGSRNVGAVYGFDTFTLAPSVAVTYGARFSRYDYLAETAGLLSPRVELTYSPDDHLRLKVLASSRALAPGAEEFLPPTGVGLWLPPQRTFSTLLESQGFQPERTDHFAVEAERDLGSSAVSLRVFHQHVADQLVTMFGVDMPGEPSAKIGHYFVGNAGDFDATGWSAGFRTPVSSRVRGSVEYSLTDARWDRNEDSAAYLMLLAPSIVRPKVDRLHGLLTSIETNVPETSTRILIICRLSSAGPATGSDRPTYDSRFDVQVHQSLPFMDFSTARWEMLLAVRNTFREATTESSVYDELLVARAPKRVVGGLTLRF